MKKPILTNGSGSHNGSQGLVYQAICRGAHTIGEIEIATGLDPSTITTHVQRLKNSGRVERRERVRLPVAHYYAVNEKCALAEAWK